MRKTRKSRQLQSTRLFLFLLIIFLIALPAYRTSAQSTDPLTPSVNAAPSSAVVNKDQVEVTISLQANASVCPPVANQRSIDAALLIDNSASMTGPKLDSAKSAASAFVDSLSLNVPQDKGGDRIGLLTFSDQPVELSPLTQDSAALHQLIDSIQIVSGTDIADAITAAAQTLTQSAKPATSVADSPARVIVLLTDGDDPSHPVAKAASAAKALGIRLVTIGLGADAKADLLRSIASVPSDYYNAPQPTDLAAIYRHIADTIQPTTAASNVVLNFQYDDAQFRLIQDSFSPAPSSVQGNMIQWAYPRIENVDAPVFSFRVTPLHKGQNLNVGKIVNSSYLACADATARRPLQGSGRAIDALWPMGFLPPTTGLLTKIPDLDPPPAVSGPLLDRITACTNGFSQLLTIILGIALSLLGSGWVLWNRRRMQCCACTGRCFLANSVLGLYSLFAVWIFALPLAAACGGPVDLRLELALWPWLLPLIPLALLAYLACRKPTLKFVPTEVKPTMPIPVLPVTILPPPAVPEPLRLPALAALWEPQPTLIIGLGKTGRWVLTYVKKSLLDATLSQPPEHIALLCLDTGDEKLLSQQEALAEFGGVRLAPDEVIELSANLGWLVDEESLYGDPQFRGWLTPDALRQLQQSTNLDLANGARQERLLARIGFLLHLRQDKDNFFTRLATIIPRCLTPDRRLNIVIVGDTMGDISSAILFDVALLAREAGRKADSKGTLITAHLITDYATRAASSNIDHDQTNTGATLREIERFQLAEARPFPIFYPEIESRRCNYLPLDNLMLYDGQTMEHLPPQEGIYPTVADVITFWMDTAAHQGALKTLQDQQRSALLREQVSTGEVQSFSQGIYSLQLPAADLLEAVRAQFEQEILRRLIMGHSNDPDLRLDPALNREAYLTADNTPAGLARAFLDGELSLTPTIPESVFVLLRTALDIPNDLPEALQHAEGVEPHAFAQRLRSVLLVLLNGSGPTSKADIFVARGGKLGFTLEFLATLHETVEEIANNLAAVIGVDAARDSLIVCLNGLMAALTEAENSLDAQITAIGLDSNDENTLLYQVMADQVDLTSRRAELDAIHSRRTLWTDTDGEPLDKRWYSRYLEPHRQDALAQLFWQVGADGAVCLTLVSSDERGEKRVDVPLRDVATFHAALIDMATRYCAPIRTGETLVAHLADGLLSAEQIAATAEQLLTGSAVPLDFERSHAPQLQATTLLAASSEASALEGLIRPHVIDLTTINSTDPFRLMVSQRMALVPFAAIKTLAPARETYKINHDLSNDPHSVPPVQPIYTAVYEAEQTALRLEADLNRKLRLRKDLLHPLVVTALSDPQRATAFTLALAAGEIEMRKLRGDTASTIWLVAPELEKRIPVESIADSRLQPLAQALLAFVLDNRAFDAALIAAMLQRYCTDMRLGRQFRLWVKDEWQDVLDKLPEDGAENRKIGLDILRVSRLFADLYKQ